MLKRLRNQLTSRLVPIYLLIETFLSEPRDTREWGTEIHQPKDSPEPVKTTVFSDVYQREIPRSLYEAGIEDLDVETGEAILKVDGIIGSSVELQRDSVGYCGLDLQDRFMRMYGWLGEPLEKVDETALVKRLGEDNPIIELVQDAKGKHEATIGRKSNLDSLLEQYPNDMTAVFNRYHG